MVYNRCLYPRLECAPCPPPQRVLDAYSVDVYKLLLEASRLGNLTADETEKIRLRCGVTIPTTTTTTSQLTSTSAEQNTPDQPNTNVTSQQATLSTTLSNQDNDNEPSITTIETNSTSTINSGIQNTTLSQTPFINSSVPFSSSNSASSTAPTNLSSSSAEDSSIFNPATFSPPANTSVPILLNAVARESPGCRGLCLVIVLTTALCLCLILLTALALLFRKRRESSKLERRSRSQQRPVSGIEYDSSSFRFTDERSLYNNGPALHFNFSDHSVAYDNPAYRQSTEFKTFGKSRTGSETRISSSFSENQSDGNIFYTGPHSYPDMPCESIPKLERRSKSLKPSKTKPSSETVDHHRRAHSMYDYVPKTLSQFSYQQIDGQDELIYATTGDRGRSRIQSLESESMDRKKSKKEKSKKRKSGKRSLSYDPMLLETYNSVPLESNPGNGFIRNETGNRTKADVNIERQNEAIGRSRCVSDYSGRGRDYVRLTSTSSDYGVETKHVNQSYHSNTDVYYTEPRPRSRDRNRARTSPSDRSTIRNAHAYNGHYNQRTTRGLPRMSIDTDLDEVFQRSRGRLPRDKVGMNGGAYDGYYRKLDTNDAPVHFPRNSHDNPDRVYVYHTKL